MIQLIGKFFCTVYIMGPEIVFPKWLWTTNLHIQNAIYISTSGIMSGCSQSIIMVIKRRNNTHLLFVVRLIYWAIYVKIERFDTYRIISFNPRKTKHFSIETFICVSHLDIIFEKRLLIKTGILCLKLK